jgi:hypothetical protein
VSFDGKIFFISSHIITDIFFENKQWRKDTNLQGFKRLKVMLEAKAVITNRCENSYVNDLKNVHLWGDFQTMYNPIQWYNLKLVFFFTFTRCAYFNKTYTVFVWKLFQINKLHHIYLIFNFVYLQSFTGILIITSWNGFLRISLVFKVCDKDLFNVLSSYGSRIIIILLLL